MYQYFLAWCFRQLPLITKLIQIVLNASSKETFLYRNFSFLLNNVGGNTFTPKEEHEMLNVIQVYFPEIKNTNELEIIGCGTIGRVYRYQDYAIKVKIPGIVELVQWNLKVACWISTVIDFCTGNQYHINRQLLSIGSSIERQYNFLQESETMQTYSDDLRKNTFENVHVPKIHYYNNDMIIMDYIHGKTLTNVNIDLHESGYQDIITRLFVYNLLVFRNIHLDLHQGNVILGDDKNIYVIDFGLSTEKMSPRQSVLFFRILECFLQEDPIGLARNLARELYVNPQCTKNVLSVPKLLSDLEYYVVKSYHTTFHYQLKRDKMNHIFQSVNIWCGKYDLYGLDELSNIEMGAAQTLSLVQKFGFHPEILHKHIDSIRSQVILL